MSKPALSNTRLPGYLFQTTDKPFHKAGTHRELTAMHNMSCVKKCKFCPIHKASTESSSAVEKAGFAFICIFISIFLICPFASFPDSSLTYLEQLPGSQINKLNEILMCA